MRGTDDTSVSGMRIEELARRSGVGVDTIRYYRKRDLLPPPVHVGRVAMYGDEHLRRLQRIRSLQDRGFNLSLIGQVLDGAATDDSLLAEIRSPESATRDEQFLTLDELATATGMAAPFLDAMRQMDVLVPRRTGTGDLEGHYTQADVEAVRIGLQLLEFDLPLDGLLELAHEVLPSTRRIAATCVALFDEHVRERILSEAGLDSEQRAERIVAAFRELLPAATRLVAHHFQRVLVDEAIAHLRSHGTEPEIEAVDDEAKSRYEVIL